MDNAPSRRRSFFFARMCAVCVTTLIAGCDDGCGTQMTIHGVRVEEGSACGDGADGPRFRSEGIFDLRAIDEGYRATLMVEGVTTVTLDSLRVFFTDENLTEIGSLPSVGAPRLTRFDDEITVTSGDRTAVNVVVLEPAEARALGESVGGALVGEDARVPVLAWITLSGRLGEVSDEPAFPISVCRGCLVGAGTVDGVNCIETGLTLVERGVCRRGQDELFSRCE